MQPWYIVKNRVKLYTAWSKFYQPKLIRKIADANFLFSRLQSYEIKIYTVVKKETYYLNRSYNLYTIKSVCYYECVSQVIK
jgi:hypothetical protein